jgi:RNA polymerase sigma-70 factor, ECF subfamily
MSTKRSRVDEVVRGLTAELSGTQPDANAWTQLVGGPLSELVAQLVREESHHRPMLAHWSNDLVQNVLLRLWRIRTAIPVDKGSRLGAWIRCIVRHAGRDLARYEIRRLSITRVRRPDTIDSVDDPLNQAILTEERWSIGQALRRIDPLRRRVLLLRLLKERTNQEAAVQLGIGTRTAQRHYADALRLLKAILLTRDSWRPSTSGVIRWPLVDHPAAAEFMDRGRS